MEKLAMGHREEERGLRLATAMAVYEAVERAEVKSAAGEAVVVEKDLSIQCTLPECHQPNRARRDSC